jgi:MFS family permease
MIFGLGWGMLEIAIPSVATLSGRPHLAAPLLATLAAAGLVGGLVIGAASIPVTPLRGFRLSQVALAVACLPLAFTTPGWSMAVVLGLMGLAVGFAQVYHWEVVEAVRPPGTATSAQAWLWTMEGSMIALGTALGGYLVEQVSPELALAGPAVCVTLATGFVWHYAASHLRAGDRPLTDTEVADALANLETTAE